MLDLDAGIDFDEVEVVVLVDDELDRAGIRVVGALHQPHGAFAHLQADFVRQVRGRGFFNQFLVSPLGRAITFPQVHDIAVVIGDDLHFHVAGPFDVLLDVDARVAEGRLGLDAAPGTGHS